MNQSSISYAHVQLWHQPYLYLNMRHNKVARILYQEIIQSENMNYKPQPVKKKNNLEIWRDKSTKTVTRIETKPTRYYYLGHYEQNMQDSWCWSTTRYQPRECVSGQKAEIYSVDRPDVTNIQGLQVHGYSNYCWMVRFNPKETPGGLKYRSMMKNLSCWYQECRKQQY